MKPIEMAAKMLDVPEDQLPADLRSRIERAGLLVEKVETFPGEGATLRSRQVVAAIIVDWEEALAMERRLSYPHDI